MNKEEKKYKSAVLQLQTALDFHNSNSLGEYNVNWASVELILEYIENLQKKAELADHYKHLYSEVKKQKDDVVELCNKSIKSINDRLAFVDTKQTYPNEYQRIRLKAFRTKCKEILRLLGECNE